ADGKEVYTSETIKRESNTEFVSLDIRGVKEIKLIADDHDGSGLGDFASWADTKFYITNSKPNLQIPDSTIIKVGENIEDLIGEFSAVDIEDGDLTDKVVVSGHESINYNKPGEYVLTYSVTDNDNNTIAKERNISVINMKDFKYLTDYDWTSAKQSYSTTKKDTNLDGKKLRLTAEDDSEIVYDRGIGSHATATIIYDLSDKDYKYFTSFVGVDRVMYNRPGSVSFEVRVDGEKKYDSGLMNAKDPQKFIEVDINGAKELKLIVRDGGNGNASDHATWGDTKLHFVNDKRIDLTSLKDAIEKAEAIDTSDYTEESINSLNLAIEEAKELLNADFVSQEQSDEAIQSIEDAISKLEVLDKVITIQDKDLEAEIKRTLNIGDREITLADMHKLVSLECAYGYVKNLNGLEYAVNLESLNIDFNEVNDISAIKNLKKLKNFSGKENFIQNSNEKVLLENGKFIIEDVVIDSDGERLLPTEVVLSPNTNPKKLDLDEVLVGNKVLIDSSLVKGTESLEILYKGKNHDYELYTFTFLTK
ncbi:MAG: NPCBM/NEW2 domain-containing protein, partial [Paraclostridium sp.]